MTVNIINTTLAVSLWSWDCLKYTFLEKLVSSVSQPNSSSLQTSKDSSLPTKITHISASVTNEVSSVTRICNTIPGRSLKPLNHTESKSLLPYSLLYK